MSASRNRALLTLVLLATLGLLVSLLISRRGSDVSAEPGAREQARADRAPRRLVGPRGLAPAPVSPRIGVDGHDYGPPGAFVRQRHDYPPDTPEKLGPKIGRFLFDLETVVDMVDRGIGPEAEIAVTRGTPLTLDEREAGRKLLQEFFDEVTPVVDGVLENTLNFQESEDWIMERRLRLNSELPFALNLTEEQAYQLWPQFRDPDWKEQQEAPPHAR